MERGIAAPSRSSDLQEPAAARNGYAVTRVPNSGRCRKPP